MHHLPPHSATDTSPPPCKPTPAPRPDGLSRRAWLRASGGATLAPILGGVLSACGGGDSSGDTAAPVPAPAPPAPPPPPPPAPPPPPPPPPPLAVRQLRVGFVRRGGSTGAPLFDVMTSRPDGSDLRLVKAFGARRIVHAIWSPDGRQIAFNDLTQASANDGWAVFVMQADGTDERLLIAGTGIGAFAWSPDSKSIAYCPQGRGQREMLGQTYDAWQGEIEIADVASGALVYRRGIWPNPVITLGPPTVGSWYHTVPRWNGLGHVLAQRIHDVNTAHRTNPGVEPAVYQIERVGTSELKEYSFNLPDVGSLLPPTDAVNPRRSYMLDFTGNLGGNVGARMDFEFYRDGTLSEDRLVLRYGDGSSQIVARDPVVRFPAQNSPTGFTGQFSWTPDGTQCAWDFQHYDWRDFLNNGPARATSLGFLPNRGDNISWLLTPA